MSLSGDQKKFIKENIRKLSLKSVSEKLQVSEDTVLAYLKEKWRDDKYRKYFETQREAPKQGSIIEKINSFNFKKWIKHPSSWGTIAFLIILIFIAYANSLNNVFLSDDLSGIANNKNIGNPNIIFEHFPFFVQQLLYFIAFKLGGLQPFFFRLENILFHLGSSILIFLIFSILADTVLAFVLASLFAVHPVLIEAVTWISGGTYSIYAFFFLLSFYFFLRWKSKVAYILSLLFYFLSATTGLPGVALSATYALFEFFFGNIKKSWLKIIPYFLVSFIIIFLQFGSVGQRLHIQQTQYYQEKGVDNPLIQVPIAITKYLELIFFPVDLTLYHSELHFSTLVYSFTILIFVSFLAFIVYLFWKNRLLSFWLLFFLISLTPTLTPLRISWTVAERYVYVGSLGVMFAIAYGIYFLIKNKKTEAVGYLVFVVILMGFMVRTIVRNIDWKNEDNLWISTGKHSPSSPNTHNNLGDVYSRHGDYERSAQEFLTAIKIKPNYADAYHNLANSYRLMGKTDDAVINYKKALEMNPNIWQTYQNLAAIYFERRDVKQSYDYLKKALEINPENAELHANIGIVLYRMGKTQEARKEFQNALQLDPKNPAALKALQDIK